MAQYRGTVQGNRTEASRLGTKATGLRVNAGSWEGAVDVHLYWNETDGHDWAEVRLTTHSNGEGASPDVILYHGRVDGSFETPEGTLRKVCNSAVVSQAVSP